MTTPTDETVEAVATACEATAEYETIVNDGGDQRDDISNWSDIARAAISAHLDALKAQGMVIVPAHPTAAMWEGFRSVNCRTGDRGMEEFTTFQGDFGNWVASYRAMIAAAEKPE